MRAALLAVVLSACAVACGGNPDVRLAPHQPSAPLIGIPLTGELEITVVDPEGRPIEGAEVILQAEPDPRRATTRAEGVVTFVGTFVVPPRFFIVCAPGFICSDWVDRETTGFGSLRQTIALQRAAVRRLATGIR